MFCYHFWFLVVFAKIALIYGYNEQRIGYGEITPPDLFQFAVFLHSPGSGCTGSIISKRHVLTAAHFIYDKESSKTEHDTYRVYGKIPYHVEVRPKVEWADKSKLPMTTTAYIPKTYTWSQWPWNDIAILEFPNGTDFGVEPVKLAKDYIEKEGDEAYITGYGVQWDNGNISKKIPSEVLRHTKITMVENCLGTLKICGGNETHKALSGDSGGPMLINRNDQWYQIGVSVKGGRYDERTRVSSFCNFIEEVTNNETQCESIFSAQNNTQMMPIKHFEPIYKGQETPSKLFDFVIPLYNYYYQQCCTATVISKRHLLTSGWCVYHNVESERLTNNSTYRFIYGNFFPDFRLKNVHLSFIEPVNVTGYFPFNYRWTGEHNLAVIEFTEGTDFGIEPVTLAKDYLQVYLEPLIVAGYGKYEFKDNMHIDGTPPKLRHTNAPFHIDTYTDINAILENKFFTQDEGGPALVERNGKFYQAAVNFYYGTANGYRVIVSSHCKFIEEVTKNEVKCESVAPIYEQPFESITKNQEEDKISVNQKSPSDAFKIESQMILFIFLSTLLSL